MKEFFRWLFVGSPTTLRLWNTIKSIWNDYGDVIYPIYMVIALLMAFIGGMLLLCGCSGAKAAGMWMAAPAIPLIVHWNVVLIRLICKQLVRCGKYLKGKWDEQR